MRIHESRSHLLDPARCSSYDNRETFQHYFFFFFSTTIHYYCYYYYRSNFISLHLRTRYPSRSTSRGYASCSYSSCPCDVAAFRIVYPLTKSLYKMFRIAFGDHDGRFLVPSVERSSLDFLVARICQRAHEIWNNCMIGDKREDRKGKKERVVTERESRRNAARRNMDNDVGRASRWAKELRRRPASARG